MFSSGMLSCSVSGENKHYDTPTNPAAPARTPGGSSSGAAVAVAANLVDFSLGELLVILKSQSSLFGMQGLCNSYVPCSKLLLPHIWWLLLGAIGRSVALFYLSLNRLLFGILYLHLTSYVQVSIQLVV